MKNEIIKKSIVSEIKQSYLNYAMSVIINRALPDINDGLKPVHRRILYTMHSINNHWNKKYKKSARIVGEVIGKYHPHGENAIYDSIIRMSQDFSLRYPLIDGQGNFGSMDGDPAAAMRYTEIKLSKISRLLTEDINENIVEFIPNYDNSEIQPKYLPIQVPNLLINGSSGIAVGMMTNIPTHNLNEILELTLKLIDNNNITFEEIIKIVPGPDFPTGGIINGEEGILEAYKTGKGKIYIQARYKIENYKNKKVIVINELPYQVNKSKLVEKIAELIKIKKINGILALRDESDKDGMRIIIEIKKNENEHLIINKLCKYTQFQNMFNINIIALVEQKPKLLNIKEIIFSFIKNREDIIKKKTEYTLKKIEKRAHILEGFYIIKDKINEILNIIKTINSIDEGINILNKKKWHIKNEQILKYEKNYYFLSVEQSKSILDLKLHQLTNIEKNKINENLKESANKIEELKEILCNKNKIIQIVKNELEIIKTNFYDKRRTTIIKKHKSLNEKDLISKKNMIVTLSNSGYLKKQELEMYQTQHRGGKGKISTLIKEQDYIINLFIVNNHDNLLCFSSYGKIYWLPIHQIPTFSRNSKGNPIINFIKIEKNETINTILPIKNYDNNVYVILLTKNGIIKKVSIKYFNKPRQNGIISIKLKKNDSLIDAKIADDKNEIMISTTNGKTIRFELKKIKSTTRTSQGVKGIKILKNNKAISLMIIKNDDDYVFSATQNGFGKCSILKEFPKSNRGGSGVITIQTNKRNGDLIGGEIITKDDDEMMLITNHGKIVRIKTMEISKIGRNTQGVKLINLENNEFLVDIKKIQKDIR